MVGDPDCLKIMLALHPVIQSAQKAGYLFRMETDTETVSLVIKVKERHGPPFHPKERDHD